MDSDIDEGAKVGNIGHDTRTDHTRLEITDAVNVVTIGEGRKLIAWITARLLEFPDDIVKSELTDLIAKRCRLPDLANATAEQIRDPLAKLAGEILEQRIAFRMNASVVERIGSTWNSEKACSQFVGLLTETWNIEQLLA